MAGIERYSVARCRACKAQWQNTAPHGRECGACGEPNDGEWVTVPAADQEATLETARLRGLIGEAYEQRGTRPMQVLRELFGATREPKQ